MSISEFMIEHKERMFGVFVLGFICGVQFCKFMVNRSIRKIERDRE